MAVASIYFDSRRPLSNGKYPIKIRVTHKQKRKYYSTGRYLDESNYKKVFRSDKTLKRKNKEIKSVVSGKLENAEYLIASMDNFNFPAFESKFATAKFQGKYTIESGYELHIEKNNLRLGTRDTYTNSLNAIKGFCIDNNRSWQTLKYGDVTAKLLSQIDEWMSKNDKKVSTRSIYLRCLRAVFNTAIDNSIISKDLYPFGRKGFQIQQSQNKKRPLSKEDIDAIYHFDGTASQNYYRDLFMFSYFSGGANLADIARMKYKHIKNDTWRFVRRKTSTTRKVQPTIEIHLTEIAKDVIRQHGNKSKPDNYVFPILRKGDRNDDQQSMRIKNVNSSLNRSIKRIAKILELDEDVSFMFGRHSYSTISRDKGINLDYISKTLGHANLNTTQNYLGQFPKGDLKKNMEAVQPKRKTQLKVG